MDRRARLRDGRGANRDDPMTECHQRSVKEPVEEFVLETPVDGRVQGANQARLSPGPPSPQEPEEKGDLKRAVDDIDIPVPDDPGDFFCEGKVKLMLSDHSGEHHVFSIQIPEQIRVLLESDQMNIEPVAGNSLGPRRIQGPAPFRL